MLDYACNTHNLLAIADSEAVHVLRAILYCDKGKPAMQASFYASILLLQVPNVSTFLLTISNNPRGGGTSAFCFQQFSFTGTEHTKRFTKFGDVFVCWVAVFYYHLRSEGATGVK